MPKTEEKYIVALDIGTSKVCVLVGEVTDRGQIEIIGKGTSPMKGTRRGNIINLDQAIEAAKSINVPAELELLHVIPREFVVDGQDGIHDPLGMTAGRLEANVHIVTGARTHNQNVLTAVNKAGIAVQELVLEQLAAAEAVLTQDEREMGVLLMDLGAGTTDYAVFLEGNVVHTNVLPVGAGHFTSDISVVLRTPMDDAERIKKRYGCALGSLVTEDDPIEVPTVGGRAQKILSKHELTNILEPRAAEIAKLVYSEIEKVGLDKEIRSGIVLVGGGAAMDGMVEMVEQVFDQQARKGLPRGLGGLSDTVNGPEWVAAAGLLLWGFRDRARVRRRARRGGLARVADSFCSWFAAS